MKTIILSAFFTYAIAFAHAQNKVYQLSSHILDISAGAPAQGVRVQLFKLNEADSTWAKIDEKKTDENGRIPDFLESKSSNKGIYKLTFLVKDYFHIKKVKSFYPFIDVVFQIENEKHCHVPITLSAYGYATYRGN